MVLVFSYVGLIAAQVAMNALVLGLLLFWAPREWGLIGPSRLGLLRLSLTSAVPAAMYLTVWAPRLPDPLEVDAVARLGILLAVALGWLVLHAVLAVAFRLPGTDALRGRWGGTAVAVALALLTSSAAPSRAGAQSAPGWEALPHDHWTLSVVEWLEATGAVPVSGSSSRPLPAARVAALLASAATDSLAGGAALAQGASARFLEEWGAGGRLPGALRIALSGGAEGTPTRLASRVEVGVGSEGSPPFGFVDVAAGDGTHLVRGGVGFRAGGLLVSAGREHVRLGGGATGALVLDPAAALDGVTLGTATPLSVGPLGELSIGGGVGPLGGYEAVGGSVVGIPAAHRAPSPLDPGRRLARRARGGPVRGRERRLRPRDLSSGRGLPLRGGRAQDSGRAADRLRQPARGAGCVRVGGGHRGSPARLR